ncbi:hypothetical protein J6O08_25290 (plasmid) [Escherichia coli]|jgi:hypothetical protein|nr:hypothetical protein [Escherichia coli]QTY38984.1 hypothetical protein J7886_24370 [Escherichia coli O128ac:H12]MBA8020884.1 hypothetical protein [Escherichia coli]MBE7625652.1 hypothetical protein [Escherichia coli]UAO82505.1 hypothetical protein J6O07_25255 [Escherichia coli]UAO96751.1 hypothetical protein J6O12_25315 [Escherichia coli]
MKTIEQKLEQRREWQKAARERAIGNGKSWLTPPGENRNIRKCGILSTAVSLNRKSAHQPAKRGKVR